MAQSNFPSSGENINHFNGIRLRVLGDGNLQLKIMSLPDQDGIQTEKDLVALNMDTIPRGVEPLKKTNFMSQRAQYELYTTEINEFFTLNRIIIFYKPVFTQRPQ